MATIALALGSSHGMIDMPAEEWRRRGEEDQLDRRFDYESLRATVKPTIEEEITPEKIGEHAAAVANGVDAVQRLLSEVDPDVYVVLSNRHGSIAPGRMQPIFGVHLNEAAPLTEAPLVRGGRTRGIPAEGLSRPSAGAELTRKVAGHQIDGELARQLAAGLIEQGVDVAVSFEVDAESDVDHAYTTLFEAFGTDPRAPYVPVLISRYLPNQATPRRCYEFGQALRRAIEGWDSDQRVAVLASGGLSHQIIDEELDRAVIAALEAGDSASLTSLDRERLNRAPGTPEILNWVALAGMMAPAPMKLMDYVPCYRSAVGTGVGVCFGYWGNPTRDG